MESQDQHEGSPLFGLSVDPLIKSHLSETAKWAKFLAIVGFIMCGLIIVGCIFFLSMVNSLDSSYGFPEGVSFGRVGPFVVIVYIIVAVVNFFPCLFLLRFANRMKAALATDNQDDLNFSFQNLKVLFRYVGILTIIVLSFYALVFVFGGLGLLIGR